MKTVEKFQKKLKKLGLKLKIHISKTGSAYFMFNWKKYRISDHKQSIYSPFFNDKTKRVDVDIYPGSGINLNKLIKDMCIHFKRPKIKSKKSQNIPIEYKRSREYKIINNL